MRSGKWVTLAVLVTATLLCGVPSAQAQVAKFSKIKDAVPLKYFNATATTPNAADANDLVIGFNSGLDLNTFLFTDFRASSQAFYSRSATDTLAFTVKAPAGYYIAKITFHQEGSGFTSRTSISYGDTTVIVAGVPVVLGTFTTNPNLTRTIDISSKRLTSVPVSISESLFATTGMVSITEADVRVQLAPLVATTTE